MVQFIARDPLFFILLCLFFVEQISYYFMGSYAYRYGFVIKRLAQPLAKSLLAASNPRQLRTIEMKIDKTRSEIYLRDRYQFGTVGPLLFVGQITIDDGGITAIRIGPLSGIFIVYIIIHALLSVHDLLPDLVGIACIALLVVWLYFRFIRNYQKLIKENQDNIIEKQ